MAEGTKTGLSSLDREHRLIRRVIDALENYASHLEVHDEVSLEDLGHFATFFTEFAELGHHVKEEDILLPAMVRRGFAWDSGPVSRVREDHDQERYLVRVLRQAAGQEAAWDEEARRHAVAAIRAFVEFQRAHFEKEESILFPAAVERFEEEELEELERRFQEFENDRFGRQDYEKLVALAERLAERYENASARDG